ncbi:MAG: AtpZ/AtpI family protein [Elusimicrobia bacterium]|nr:AtpZ/AtpI family protein [Elusimicrobiota bacterium]
MPEEKETSQEAQRSALAVALSVGWELAVCTGLSFWLGYWLDGRFRSSPWGVLVCTIAGISVALYRLVKTFSGASNGGTRRR